MGHVWLAIKRRLLLGRRERLRSLFVESKQSSNSCVDPMVKLVTGGVGRPLNAVERSVEARSAAAKAVQYYCTSTIW